MNFDAGARSALDTIRGSLDETRLDRPWMAQAFAALVRGSMTAAILPQLLHDDRLWDEGPRVGLLNQLNGGHEYFQFGGTSMPSFSGFLHEIHALAQEEGAPMSASGTSRRFW